MNGVLSNRKQWWGLNPPPLLINLNNGVAWWQWKGDCILIPTHHSKTLPAILMGAALEEYLKKLAEKNNIDISDIKQTIEPISNKLYKENIISKKDLKDISSWAGIRNDATHVNFEEINDRKRVANAIEGVNLFMRKSDL